MAPLTAPANRPRRLPAPGRPESRWRDPSRGPAATRLRVGARAVPAWITAWDWRRGWRRDPGLAGIVGPAPPPRGPRASETHRPAHSFSLPPSLPPSLAPSLAPSLPGCARVVGLAASRVPVPHRVMGRGQGGAVGTAENWCKPDSTLRCSFELMSPYRIVCNGRRFAVSRLLSPGTRLNSVRTPRHDCTQPRLLLLARSPRYSITLDTLLGPEVCDFGHKIRSGPDSMHESRFKIESEVRECAEHIRRSRYDMSRRPN